MSELKELYTQITELYGKREGIFKQLGRETYLNWIMGLNIPSLVEFDKQIKELDEQINQLDLKIKELE